MLRWGLYGLCAVTAYAMGKLQGGRNMLAFIWHTAGGILVLSALLAIYSVVPLDHGIAHTSNRGISATGARLGGLLQYPNTFGVLMAAFLLERLFSLIPLLQRGPSTARLMLASLPLLPYTAALLLSESRGAWLAAGVVTAIGLLLERRRIIAPLLLAAAPIACAALLYRQLAAAQLAVFPVPGLLWLAGLWAGSMLAGLGLLRLRGEAAGALGRRFSLAAAGMLWTAGAAAVFWTVRERITANYSTVSARGAMYRDAWKLVEQAPWFGQGGDTWRMSYRAVQSQPYVGNQVHSGYMDILLNTGVVGLMMILMLIISAGWLLWRNNRLLLPAYGVIVLHSIADIDWSFGLIWLLMFVLIGQAASPQTAKSGLADFQLNGRSVVLRNAIISMVSMGLVITAALTVVAFRGQMANTQHDQALYERNNLRAIALLKSSLQWNPADYSTALDLASVLPAKEAKVVLTESLSYNPGHAALVWELANNASRLGDAEEAITWIRSGRHYDLFNAEQSTKSLGIIVRLAREELADGHRSEARRIIQIGAKLYLDYKEKAGHILRNPIRNDREFRLTSEAQMWATQLNKMGLALAASH
ncbi:hypothetical protein JCM16418A_44900 [Paenibacillus pini]